ncbi:hypothetical protein [Actinacidiphila soli]|uniref:hypothetical protein n=1 Tax=Actinacidiphila soli TaxID=2487275 RepID=UPI000FCAD507|nr:hypothetical protein [Actinacidiphila soli]
MHALTVLRSAVATGALASVTMLPVTAAVADDSSASPTPSSSPSSASSASASPAPTTCTVIDDDSLDVSLSGLPVEVTAGGGWGRFTVLVHNRGTHTIDGAAPSISLSPYDRDELSDFDLQFQDPDSGRWKEIPVSRDFGSPFTYVTVVPGATTQVPVRVRASADAPDGGAGVMVYGQWDNGDGTCGTSDGDQGDINLTAASPTASASPAPSGSASASAAPSASPSTTSGTDTQTASRSALADTGSPSALPALAVTGGAALAVGTGALVVVRRRRNTTR